MEWRLTWQHLATARFSPSLNLPCARCVGKKCGRDGVTIYESKKAQVAMGGLHYVLHLLGSEPSSEAGQRSLARSPGSPSLNCYTRSWGCVEAQIRSVTQSSLASNGAGRPPSRYQAQSSSTNTKSTWEEQKK